MGVYKLTLYVEVGDLEGTRHDGRAEQKNLAWRGALEIIKVDQIPKTTVEGHLVEITGLAMSSED